MDEFTEFRRDAVEGWEQGLGFRCPICGVPWWKVVYDMRALAASPPVFDLPRTDPLLTADCGPRTPVYQGFPTGYLLEA
jgi:hypothetical protein